MEKSYPPMDPLLLLVDALAALPPSNITPSHLRILLQHCPPFQRRESAGSTSPLQVPHGAFRDPHFLYVKPPSVTQLQGLVSVAQFLAKTGGLYHNELLTPVLDFLQAMIPLSNQYPSAPIFSSPSLGPFLSAILSLLSELATSCPETRPEISASVATSVLQVTGDRRVGSDHNGIQGRRDNKSATHAGCELLLALGERCPPLEPEHALAAVESLQRYWEGLPSNRHGKSTVTGPSGISQEGGIEAPSQLVEKLLNVKWQGGEAEESGNRAGNGTSLEGERNGHLKEANGEVPDGIEEVEDDVSVDGDMVDALSALDGFSMRSSAADSCRDLSQFQTSGQSPGSMAMLRANERLEGKQVAFRIMAQVLGEGAGSNLQEHPIKNQYLAAARQQLKDTRDLLQVTFHTFHFQPAVPGGAILKLKWHM